MQYLALSVLLSASVWSLTLLLSTFIRAASGTGPILTLVYAHPYQLLLIAGVLLSSQPCWSSPTPGDTC